MAKPKRQRKDIQTRIIQRYVPAATSAGAKVTVYCKIPSGLLIRPCEMVPNNEQVMGGGVRKGQIGRPIPGAEILVNGPATEIGKRSMSAVMHGFAVTRGVLKDHWEKWLEDNEESPMVKNKLIFATPGDGSDDDVGQAREMEDAETGFEPLDTEVDDKGRSLDPRVPRPSNRRNLSDVSESEGAGSE
jgi:hypothetical protein